MTHNDFVLGGLICISPRLAFVFACFLGEGMHCGPVNPL